MIVTIYRRGRRERGDLEKRSHNAYFRTVYFSRAK